VRIVFWTYVLVIAAGITFYLVVGIKHL